MTAVSRQASLQEVIEAILDGGLRTVAVVSEEGKLVGLITEGDIVRAVARGAIPGLSAEGLMNLEPRFVVEKATDDELVRDFLEHGRLAVPVVDHDGNLLKVESTVEAVLRLIESR